MKPKNWNCLTAKYIAGLFDVSEKTVSNWISRNGLKAWRIPSPSQKRNHWRVTVQDLAVFCKRLGMPIPDEIRTALVEQGYAI